MQVRSLETCAGSGVGFLHRSRGVASLLGASSSPLPEAIGGWDFDFDARVLYCARIVGRGGGQLPNGKNHFCVTQSSIYTAISPITCAWIHSVPFMTTIPIAPSDNFRLDMCSSK